jgi:hypothetical protein
MINDQSFHKLVKLNKLLVILRKAKREVRKVRCDVRNANYVIIKTSKPGY